MLQHFGVSSTEDFFRGPGETARSVCLAEVTTNNSSQEVRAAPEAPGYITEKKDQ